MDLTPKQRETLDWIVQFIREQGMPPTVREIGKAFGIKSSSTFQRLQTLENKGVLKRGPLGARSLKVMDAMKPSYGGCAWVPLIGRIAAGQPILAIENIEDTLPVNARIVHGKTFALKVQGDSMIEDGILEGDFVIVRQQDTARDGDIVVALVAEEATVKRFYREGKRNIRLQPANAHMAPLVFPAREVQIQGKVVAVERILE